MASMSAASASVTTSAGRPSITARAWRPEPLCDWVTVTVSPVFFFQYSAKALLKSSYNSRVGSYETLSSLTSAAFATPAAPPMNTALAIEISSRRFQLGEFMLSGSNASVVDCEAREQRLLVIPVAGRGAAVEAGVFVVQRQLHRVPRVPVDADAPRALLADRGGRVGERVRTADEGIVIHVELVIARHQFDGTEAGLAGLPGAARGEAAVSLFFAGDEPRELRLPGLVGQRVGQRVAADGTRHVLLDLGVLAEEAEAAAVVVHLRCEAQPLAVSEGGVVRRGAGRGVGPMGKHVELAG